MSTVAHRSETLALTAVGLGCAFASSVAFFLHVLGFVRMPFFVSIAGLPVVILMLVVGLYSWQRNLPFWWRFRAGVIAGAIGLLAYDAVRFVIYRSRVLDYDPFHAVPILGSLITGQPATSQPSVAAGWAYHFWNGFSFAIIYALLAGPAPWGWGLAWAMFLEAGMLFAYPSFLAIQARAPFVAVSIIGHAAYGTALGITVSRLLRRQEEL